MTCSIIAPRHPRRGATPTSNLEPPACRHAVCAHDHILTDLIRSGYLEARLDEAGQVHLYTTPLGEALLERP